ncbi:basic blue protein-like [Durio zibethinus]|uniref:Basic blue protein-like n=1 Tax=Durio zibethinus TaxID=66656 RepID=A0A6P5Z8Y2_DURZI|nr:basic blue protein-like [Durio zibethinus]
MFNRNNLVENHWFIGKLILCRKIMRKGTIKSSKLVLAAMLLFMVLQFQAIHARVHHSKPTKYTVGDEEGWDLVIDMESWTRGKPFHARDLLVFKYDAQRFDVAVVNQEGHDSCTVNDGAKVFNSGNTKISLVFGANYFIDSAPDVCAAGMKMAINATAPPPSF